MTRRPRLSAPALLAAAAAVTLQPSPQARAGEALQPLASHVIETDRRTLHGLPLKALVTSAAGWTRLTEGLPAPPPAPEFAAGQVALVVAADASGGVENELAGLERVGDAVRAVLVRRGEGRPGDDARRVRCFVAVLPDWGGGVELVHRTHLPDGMGTIERRSPPLPSDREQRLLPRLGPDLRLSVAMADGSAPPEGVLLRVEVHYGRKGLPGKVVKVPFPAEGLIFPRLRDGARYVYAAYSPVGLRTRNPLVLRALPRSEGDGSPRPLAHQFLLEPVPGEPR